MTDEDFIVELMRRDTDALGFIPRPALHDRITRRGRFILQRDGFGRRRGYLLHGPPRPNQPLRIYQVCVDVDHRRILHATQMLDELLRRAREGGATEILLRCATDLAANAFWRAIGAIPTATIQGGRRRRRQITLYRLPVPRSRTIAVKVPEDLWAFKSL